MTPPELIVPCPFLKLKFCADVPDSLCPLPYSCILCLYAVYDLYEIPILELLFICLSKFCISPSLCISTCLPLLVIYKLSLYSQNEWKNVIKMIKIWYSPIYLHISPYTYLLLMYISPHFWHWCQRVLRSNTILSQKSTIYLQKYLESCIPIFQWLMLDNILSSKVY